MNDRWNLFDSRYAIPDGHDYDTLAEIYAHLGGTGGTGDDGGSPGGPPCSKKPEHHHCTSGSPGNSNGAWGKAVGHDNQGRANQFEKDLGGGHKTITFVTWAN